MVVQDHSRDTTALRNSTIRYHLRKWAGKSTNFLSVKKHRQQLAWSLWNHQWFAGLAKDAVRAEDRSFYQALATRAGHVATVEGLTALWKELKAALPKHRCKRKTIANDLHDDLLVHFENLEDGRTPMMIGASNRA